MLNPPRNLVPLAVHVLAAQPNPATPSSGHSWITTVPSDWIQKFALTARPLSLAALPIAKQELASGMSAAGTSALVPNDVASPVQDDIEPLIRIDTTLPNLAADINIVGVVVQPFVKFSVNAKTSVCMPALIVRQRLTTES